MNRLALACFACSLVACSDDADIGIATQPVTCTTVGEADVVGALTTANGTNSFGAVTPRIDSPTRQPTVHLTDGARMLSMTFLCDDVAQRDYNVINHDRHPTVCPVTVIGGAADVNEYVQVESGTLIVDEVSNCLAGRFAIDFGAHGELSGWFSAPWQ